MMLLTRLLQMDLDTFVSKSLLKGQVFLTLVQMWGTKPEFLVVEGIELAVGVASFFRVWVLDLVPYSLQLKNSPIANSFHMGVL